MSASTVSHRKGPTGTASIGPSEIPNNLFPKGATASTLASTTSSASTAETPLGSNSPAFSHPLSPLDREYTKPLQDLDIARQLSKQPTYWSVKGWVKRSASLNVQPAREDLEGRTRKCEKAKRDLLASVGRF
ncbi:hypothetical protein F4824DRAFT_442609 [Ustulina deusta]|nr:hypothetical protein F4824DRAFT_442609 [Ustulina deusta]